VSEKSLCSQTDCNFVSFTYINVSQGIVATQFRCGEIINNRFIANFPKSVTVKEFLKSVKILRRYGKKYGGMFFLTHGVYKCICSHNGGTSAVSLMPLDRRL